MNGLSRTLGPFGASAIGLASMVGAGVFYVFAPAAALAGAWVLVALVIAGSLALLNAVSMAQLSVHNPVAGGAYSFATRYVSPRVGFLAGWLFLAGKTASVAAIAVIAASYISVDFAPFIAAGVVLVFALVNISGVRTTAWVSIVIAAVVVGTLITVAGVGISQGGFRQPTGGSISGVLQASGLLFFAFAGYARMSTLGEEVKNPERVLPRVIVGTLLGVLALYALVGSALLWGLGTEALASSVAPVADLAPASARAFVVGIAVLASLGSLMTVLAGLSRVTLAMARDGNLPKPLAVVWSVTSSPARAELSVAGIAVVLVLSLEPLWLVGASAGSVLLYYAIAHWSALRQPASERLVWRVVPWCGLVGCVVVVATLPLVSLLTTIVLAGSGMLAWTLRQWWTSRSR